VKLFVASVATLWLRKKLVSGLKKGIFNRKKCILTSSVAPFGVELILKAEKKIFEQEVLLRNETVDFGSQ
jgi:hypothetical protein